MRIAHMSFAVLCAASLCVAMLGGIGCGESLGFPTNGGRAERISCVSPLNPRASCPRRVPI